MKTPLLPNGEIDYQAIVKPPLLPNGKIDYHALWLMALGATREILFWSKTYRPHDFINRPNPRADIAVQILRNPKNKMGYMGFALCRICDAHLGSHDFAAHGFVWPQGAEHYIIAHQLWIPELDDLIAAANPLAP